MQIENFYTNLFSSFFSNPQDFKNALIFSISKSSDILALLTTSLIIRILLEIIGERWIKTFSQTCTIFLLPIITYIITTVISGNIALSLGMVGALSIVRFRNPVRSPFQLTIYFGVISMGIATSVDIKWLFLIIFITFFLSLFLVVFSILYRMILKKPLFVLSFTEGNSLSSLEISSKEKVKLLEDSKSLKSSTYINNIFSYLLTSDNLKELKSILIKLDKNSDIISYQLNE